MQWGQIKTLFIVCFLVLNVYLVMQLVVRQEDNLSFIPEATKEDELALNINGLEDLSTESYTAPLIYAHNYNYSENAIDQLELLSNQQAIIVDETFVFSRFNEPVPINMDDAEAYKEVLDYSIIHGHSYEFWAKSDHENVLIFFQRFNDPVFYNQNAVLFIQLNQDGDMIQYVQTRLQREDDAEQEQELIQQYDAVSRLYHNLDKLQTGDTVSDIKLGYHNLISLPNGEQVLNPAWNVVVNETEHYFINAVEGHDYPINEDFFKTTLLNFTEILEGSSETSYEFVHTSDDEDQERLLNVMRHSLVSLYHTINGVDSE